MPRNNPIVVAVDHECRDPQVLNAELIESIEVDQRRGRVKRHGVKVKGHAKEVSGKSIEIVYRTYVAKLKQRNKNFSTPVYQNPGGARIDFEWFFEMAKPLPVPKKDDNASEGK